MTRHRFDALSFIFGALFVAVAAIPILGVTVLTVSDLAWLAPAVLVLMGAVLLITSVRRGSEPHADDTDTNAHGLVDAEPDEGGDAESVAQSHAEPDETSGDPEGQATRVIDASRTSRAPDAPEVGDGPAGE